MGLSNFHSPNDGVLPLLVMHTVMSLALVMNMLKSILQVVGAAGAASTNLEFNEECCGDSSRMRRVSITRYRSLCETRRGGRMNECCVCLCGFKGEEEVSELSCKHFFHKGCLDKWFGNSHVTCPICRSIM